VSSVLEPADLALNAADPADALRRAERLFEAAAGVGLSPGVLGESAVRIATLACGAAPYLATLIGRDPYRLVRVAADPYLRREKPREVLAAELASQVGPARTAAELRAALRRVRADELVRLGVRELELGLPTEVGRELARLADLCFDAAIDFHDRELRNRYGVPLYSDGDTPREARLTVIGMGKLGGEELNFSSDVDVIYIYTSEDGSAGELSLHEYFAKLCTQVTAAIAEVTEDDMVFRVDLRLRPEGARGSIALSLAQTERYYETFGRPWERQAWIKARPCAGDLALGAEALTTLRPFVFPRIVSPTVLDDVRELNRRIKRELVRPASSRVLGFDLKNGEGGIREIEFFVQALQLIHSGKQPALRVRGTLPALDALLFAGLVTDDEHAELAAAYRWLRHAEHVLQLEAGLQTQTIPSDSVAAERFARRLGYAGGEALATELAAHTGAVARMFATLGDDTEDDRVAADADALMSGELDEAGETAALARLGFVDIVAARAELARARRHDAQRAAGLLRAIAASADPDQALRFLVDLIAKRGEAWSIWKLLAENPPMTRLLGSLLGASEYLARTLVDTPELIDLLAQIGSAPPTKSSAQIDRDLAAHLARVNVLDPEEAWSAIAEVKAANALRVGVADFGGALDALAVCKELTAIAEACLRGALAVVERGLAVRHGRPPGGARLAVLGLGKLGGGELGYAADLDVVFVFDGDDAAETDGPVPLATIDWFSRCAQRLLGGLRLRTPRGRLYEVDTRLRPSGTQGLLVSSLPAWRRYHAEVARTWERQALTKLRAVAGDPALGAEVEAHAQETVYGAPPADPVELAGHILGMRRRMERELSSGDDLKTGAGGVVDVEFAAQYLQLAHGHAHPALRTRSTVEALAAAAVAGVAPEHELELLMQGYRFLRGIENRLRVVNDRPVHRLPTTRAELDQLARRSGFPDGKTLREHVERWQRDIRAAAFEILSPRRLDPSAPPAPGAGTRLDGA